MFGWFFEPTSALRYLQTVAEITVQMPRAVARPQGEACWLKDHLGLIHQVTPGWTVGGSPLPGWAWSGGMTLGS